MTAGTNGTSTKRSVGVFGLGAAACAVCCAGPVLGIIAATGLLTVTGMAVLGAVGLLVAVPGVILAVGRQARRSTDCGSPAGPEPVALSESPVLK